MEERESTDIYKPAYDLIDDRREIFDAALEELFGEKLKGRRRPARLRSDYSEKIDWLVPNIMRLIDLRASAAESPPRRSEVRQLVKGMIKDLEALIGKTLRVIKILSMSACIVFPSRPKNPEIWKHIDACHLSTWPQLSYINGSALIGTLRAFKSLLKRYLTYLPPDSGGRCHILSSEVGNWKMRLVAVCGRIFSDVSPRDLTAEINGPFYGFCGLMYELLTGEPAHAKNVGLKRYVVYAVPRLKEQNRIIARIETIPRMSSDVAFQIIWGRTIIFLWDQAAAIQSELEAGPMSRNTASSGKQNWDQPIHELRLSVECAWV